MKMRNEKLNENENENKNENENEKWEWKMRMRNELWINKKILFNELSN